MDSLNKIAKFYNEMEVNSFIQADIENMKNIYHYTSPEGFLGIIGENEFWFTEHLYLNDKTEGVHVLYVCMDLIKHLLGNQFYNDLYEKCKRKLEDPSINNFHTFQLSFSFDGDSLPLWNYYTKDSNIQGYNIKFNVEKLINSTNDNVEPGDFVPDKPKIYGGKVVYDKEEQKKIVNEVILKFKDLYDEMDDYREMVIELTINKLLSIGVFLKNSCFECENEYRLVIDLWMNENGNYATVKNEIKYYIKNGLIIPYMKVKFDKDSVEGIAISPTLGSDLIKRNLREFTRSYKNINNENIVESAIPLRY